MRSTLRATVSFIALALAACTASTEEPSDSSDAAQTVATGRGFSLAVDPTARTWRDPNLHRAHGAEAVDFVVDAAGVSSIFVRNEVVVAAATPAELAAFLAKYGGHVVGDDAVPAPPPGLQVQMDPRFAAPTSHVVRVDTSRIAPSTLATTAPQIGLTGKFRVSSSAGAGLLALAAHAAAHGMHVGPNFVAESAGSVLLSTQEMPSGGGFLDGFAVSQYATTGSKSGVTAAWQYVVGHGIARRAKVAIIDGGFWLTTTGAPNVDVAGRSDLPLAPTQYDFDGDDYVADGANPASCTGGSSCPWHGNGSAGTAVGIANNSTGAAGTGGFVADPMLFKVDNSDGNVKRALRTAIAWHADIVSMSFGRACNKWCRLGRNLTGYANPFFEARDAGLALFAAAGNDAINTVDNDVWPCTLKAVSCVGALADGTSKAIAYSNWPAFFAPTNIPAMPNAITAPTNTIHNGTSAATPFMAGVAAMVKAIDPSLSGSAVQDILYSTAWTGSGDPKVGSWVNAYAAVSAAAKHLMPPDSFEPNDTAAAATTIGAGTITGLSIESAGAVDVYRVNVPAFSSLDVSILYDGLLGDPILTVAPEGAPGVGATGVKSSASPNRRGYHADLLPPGSYLVTVRGYSPNVYDLSVASSPSDLAPDMFEADDTFATSAAPKFGDSFEVNFHIPSDVDYYRFDVPPKTSITLGARFQIDVSDSPVTAHLLDSSGVEIASSATALELVPGTLNWVKVDGGGKRGRYVFSSYPEINPALFPVYTPYPPFSVHVVGPSDGPTDHIATDGPDWFAVDHTPFVDYVAFYGEGVHATLIDANGNTVAEGVPAPNLQASEALFLANVPAQAAYFIRVVRTDQQNADAPASRHFALDVHSMQ